MHISNCQHPQIVLDPVSGEKRRVRCNKCSSCLNAKAKNWVNRLTEESEHNRYAFMVNLTYDDQHLPMLTADEVGNLVWFNRPLDLCIPFQDVDDVINKSVNPERERYYLEARLSDRLHIPCICVDDVQKFNKRLNKYFHDKYTNLYGNFRYFICFEYGPATYRIHAHGEYWCNSPVVAEHFSEAISACWSLGDSSVAHIYSKGGHSYVAQYVNMSTHLPAIYALPDLRQKHIFSKCPPIGSPSLLASEVRRIYDEQPVRRVVWDAQTSRYADLPVSATFKDRYFPKCEGYSRKSNFARIGLYRSTEFLPSGDYKEFADAVYSLVARSKENRFIPTSYEKALLTFTSDLFMNSRPMDRVDNKLYKIYLVSKRFLYLRSTLDMTSGQLLKAIDSYYKKLDYERLKDFYLFQQNYAELHDPSDLMHMYPDFVDWVNDFVYSRRYSINDVPEYIKFALQSFGYDVRGIQTFPFVLSKLEDSYDFRNMRQQHDKIYKDTHKAHDVHNYRYSETFHRLNPELQKIIQTYENYGS